MKDQLFTKVAEEVSNSDERLQWASSAVTLINQSAAPDAIEARPSSSTRGTSRAEDSH
jgi:hypothetical protein